MPEAPAPDVPLDSIQYVGGQVCAGCHTQEYQRWQGSDHDRAMEHATAETVLGDFGDARFTHFGVTTRFFREGDRFLVHTEGPTGRMETFEVKYTFGVRPLQQYLVEFPDGRVQALTIAWDTERKRWFSLYPEERIRHDDWLHWTKGGMNWNYMCATCHSTNLQKNFDLATNTYHTTFSEIDVSCEACHGPGEQHVAWAQEVEATEEPSYEGDLGLTVRLGAHTTAQVETCAPCHARRRVVHDGFAPGAPLLDHYAPELLADGLYYPDGQIEDEVYVYGSFVQSKMFHNGVACADCHDPHSTRVLLEGNLLCTRCHAPEQYDVAAHHFHPEGTAGTACVDCHMPERTYMEVDPRRDHSFKVPRPDLSVDYGVPNACNGCHKGRSAAWARDQVVAWYGSERKDTLNFAATFAAARAGAPEAEAPLARIVQDGTRPALVRATALSLLRSYDSAAGQVIAQQALTDHEPLVRAEAVRNLEGLPPEELRRHIAPLVEDPVRLVRTEAARVLARIAREAFGNETPQPETAQAFFAALEEYRAGQQAVSDQPGAHLNLAVVHEQLEEWQDAERAYQTALRLDSAFVPARINLAMLYDRRRLAAAERGQHDVARQLGAAAEAQLRRAVQLQPELAEVHYTLGLLLAEQEGRLEEAAQALAEAARLAPGHARIQYNTGLAFQQLERRDEAEPYLLRAHELEPRQPDYLNALAILYIQQQRWAEALTYNEALAQQYPNVPAVQQRTAYIRQQMGG